MSVVPFFVPDTSSILAYSSCVNCAASGSWQAAYSPAGDGWDQTFHQTSMANSSVTFNITASSIAVSSQASSSDCGAEISVNGSTFASECDSSSDSLLSNLSRGTHQVVVRPKQDVTSFQFTGISGTIPLTSPGSHTNTTMDDNSFNYSPGDWTQIGPNGVVGSAANQSIASDYPDVNSFMNHTAGISTKEGASVNITFRAEAIYVYGMNGPDGGSAMVLLDGQMTQTLNLTTPWRAYHSLLYIGGGFNATETHSLRLVNTTPGRQLVMDYALLTVSSRSSYVSSHLPLIIGIISGVSAVLLLLGIITFVCCMRHRRTPRRNPYGSPAGVGPVPHGGSVDTWRKNADEASPTTPCSDKSRRPGAIQTSYRSATPDYPDYLPYRGPVQSRPPSEYEEPPAIAGGNSLARGWLQRRATSPVPSFASATSDGSNQSVYSSRPPHLPSLRNGDRFDDIALDSYSHPDTDHLDTPGSAPSSLGLTGVTARAVGATRSVARLWPSREAVPSTFRRTSTIPNTDSMIYASSYTTAGKLSSNASQLIGSGLASRSTNRDLPHSNHSSSHPSSPYTLRRGVSIKSVKTMRSFFSGLLFQPSSFSPTISAPALPQPAARPDSGLFPIGSLCRSSSSLGTGAGLQSTSVGGRRGISPALRLEGGRKTSPNLFIELNPNSPMTVAPSSRPDSEWTQWRSG